MSTVRSYESCWEPIDDGDDLAYVSAADAYKVEPDLRHELLRLAYPDYLKTPHWDHMRRRALLRAGHQCQRCESRHRRLEVHHLTYDRLGREAEADLIVLCSRCHDREHGNNDYDLVAERMGERFANDFERHGMLAKVAAGLRDKRP